MSRDRWCDLAWAIMLGAAVGAAAYLTAVH